MGTRDAARAIVLNGDSLLVMKRTKMGDVYYTLIGGGIEPGESPEQAMRRELMEETGMVVGAARHVFTEEPSDRFGSQYVFLCTYEGGDPKLAADSEEAADSAGGSNMYEPMWLPLAQLPVIAFRSESVRTAILQSLEQSFPDEPQQLAFRG